MITRITISALYICSSWHKCCSPNPSSTLHENWWKRNIIALMSIIFLFKLSHVNAQTAFTAATVITTGSSTSYSTAIQNPHFLPAPFSTGTSYTHSFYGTKNVRVTSVTANGNMYYPFSIRPQVILRRNALSGLQGSGSGTQPLPWNDRQIFYAEGSLDTTNGIVNAVTTYPGTVNSTDQPAVNVLFNGYINTGIDNTFVNVEATNPGGNINANNIERVDFIYPSPIRITTSNISSGGIVIANRNSNDDGVVFSAIKNISGGSNTGSGTNFQYSNIIKLNNTWTQKSINGGAFASLSAPSTNVYTLPSAVIFREWDMDGTLNGSTSASNPSADNTNGSQNINGLFFTFQDLGLQVGDYFYGFSAAGLDFPGAAGSIGMNSYLDPAYFPLQTNDTNGGVDLILNGMFYLLNVSGNVWNDMNANGIIDGTEQYTDAGGLYALLVDSSNMVLDVSSVDASTGSYTLSNLTLNTTGYKIILTTNNPVLGSTYIAGPSLPTYWINTADITDPSNTAPQGATLGVIELATQSDNIVNQNFGIKALAPFTCSPLTFYLSQYPNGGPTSFYTLNSSTNPFTTSLLGTTDSGYQVNAMGYNTVDNYIYGIRTDAGNTNHLVITDANGTTVDLGAVTGLPIGGYNAGAFDDSGNFYVLSFNFSVLYKINVTTLTVTSTTLARTLALNDFAYDKITGLLYGFDVTNDVLVSVNPATGAVTNIGSTNTAFASTFVGAMYSDANGNIFGNVDDGLGFYQFNKTTGVPTLISSSISAFGNDGANCVNAVAVFPTDLSVTKTDGKLQYTPGTTNIYTIVVSNIGEFGATGATVTDAVPAGIPAGNVSYTAVASSGSSTNVVGTQTGAINDVVSIPPGGNVTYTVTINIPSLYMGDLVNTVSVAVPSSTFPDIDLANNTATDTDVQAVCYRPATTAGTSLPSNHGITALGRAGTGNGNWPMVRTGAWTVLEAKTKGFVVNRVPTTAEVEAIPNPIEGMMVYDIQADCLKINIDGTSTGWKCFNTPTCPPTSGGNNSGSGN